MPTCAQLLFFAAKAPMTPPPKKKCALKIIWAHCALEVPSTMVQSNNGWGFVITMEDCMVIQIFLVWWC